MRPVHQASFLVVPAPQEMEEPHGPVRDVRYGDDEPASRRQQRPQAAEQGLRLPEVLQDVRAEDGVVRPGREVQLHPLDVPDDDPAIPASRLAGGRLVVLDAVHRRAPLDQPPAEAAARAADVEHRRGARAIPEHELVGGVRVRAKLDVVGHGTQT